MTLSRGVGKSGVAKFSFLLSNYWKHFRKMKTKAIRNKQAGRQTHKLETRFINWWTSLFSLSKFFSKAVNWILFTVSVAAAAVAVVAVEGYPAAASSNRIAHNSLRPDGERERASLFSELADYVTNEVMANCCTAVDASAAAAERAPAPVHGLFCTHTYDRSYGSAEEEKKTSSLHKSYP